MKFQRWICLVQAALLATAPCYGALVPMGVARVGTSPGVKAVQGRVERWLAGEESRVRRVQEGIAEDALAIQKTRARFIRLLDEMESVLAGSPNVPALTKILERTVEPGKVAEQHGWGALVQRWYLGRALWAAARGEENDFLYRARALHPQGKLVRTLPNQDWFRSWQAKPIAATLPPPRQCAWKVTGEGQVWVNGFLALDRMHLAPGSHVLLAQEKGQWFERQIRCDRPSRQVWDLETAIPLGNRSPDRIVQRYGVDHLWLVERGEGGTFRLIVFTPGFGAEEVPVASPLGEGGLLSPFEGEFRVDWDQARQLLQSHRTQVVAQRGHLGWNQVTDTVETPDEWYNDWKFWAITAGVVGGVLAVISLSREDQVQTQPNPGIAITF